MSSSDDRFFKLLGKPPSDNSDEDSYPYNEKYTKLSSNTMDLSSDEESGESVDRYVSDPSLDSTLQSRQRKKKRVSRRMRTMKMRMRMKVMTMTKSQWPPPTNTVYKEVSLVQEAHSNTTVN